MRVTIDLMKKSTQIIDLSNVINPRVGDDDLQLPLHIGYGDNLFDMRGKDVEFLSNDPNKKNIYIAGTCNTNTPGDNLYMGDLTFRFPAGTFQADGTYDPDKTMFRIVDKETQKVISSVNVKITVMKNAIEFDFDPDKTSYDSRLENMLHDFHDKGQTMLDEIKDLKNQANSNVSGDTATTANQAKQQADANAGDISDLKGEVAGARGRFANMAGREDAQDAAINQKESIVNANANYAALRQKDAQQDVQLAQKAGRYELENKLAQLNLQPEMYADLNAVKAAYPNGASKMIVTDDGYLALYQNGQWVQGPVYQAVGLSKQVSDRIKGIQQRNLIPDAEFADDLTKSWIIEPNVALRTDPSDKFHGHTPAVLEKTSADAQGGVALVIPTPTSECSFSVQTKWAPGDSNSLAFITITFFASNDGSGESIGQKVITLDTAVSDWKQRVFINFTPPFNAASARFEMRILGTGTLKVAEPLLTDWPQSAPYDIDALYQNQLMKSKTNLIDNANFDVDPMTTFPTNFPVESVNVISGKGDQATGAQGYQGHNVLHLSKKDGKDDFQALSFKVDVMAGIPLSYELFFNFVPTGTGVMYIDNYWLAADGTTVQTDHIDLTSYSNNMWNRLTKNNISVPGGASSLSIYVAINQGDLYLACPRAVNDAFIGGYDSEETMRKLIAARDTNLISDAEFNYFPFPNDSWFSSLNLSKLSIDKGADGYCGHNALKITKDDGNVNAWDGVSVAFNYTSGRSLSEMVAFKFVGQDSTAAVLSIDFMDGANGQGNSIKHSQQMFSTQNEWDHFIKSNINVPVGTNSVRLGFLINQGTLWIAMPTAVESANVGPHDYDMLSKQVTDHLKIPIVRLSALDTNPLSADTYQNYRMEWVEPMRTITGYAKLAWQGDSSLNLDKKNYKFKLFSDEGFTNKLKFKPYPEFYRSNTFHLKANFTNRYLINNGYNADMYRQFIFANDTAPQKLIDASHQGMICARPVLVYLNSQFMGVYTVNTKKGSDLYNTDEKDKNQIAIQSNGGEGARWTKAVGLTFGETEGCDFEIESDNTEAVEPAVGRLATFIVNSSDTDFKNNLSQYFNVKSLLDYIIFADLTINTDGLHVKNSTYVTYDAKVWYILPYDLDSTLGSYWDPTKPQDPDTSVVGQLNTNLLKRVYKLFRDELKQRVAELRTAGVLDKSKWFTEWEKRVNEIGEPLLETEWQRWPNNPAYSRGTSYNEVLSLINHRFKRLDWDF